MFRRKNVGNDAVDLRWRVSTKIIFSSMSHVMSQNQEKLVFFSGKSRWCSPLPRISMTLCIISFFLEVESSMKRNILVSMAFYEAFVRIHPQEKTRFVKNQHSKNIELIGQPEDSCNLVPCDSFLFNKLGSREKYGLWIRYYVCVIYWSSGRALQFDMLT